MASRLLLHDELKELLGTNEVHFQPPESKKLVYPCIVYNRGRDKNLRADNKQYHRFDYYNLTYLTRDPDDEMINKITSHFQSCSLVGTNHKDYLNMYHYDLYY